VTTPLSLRTKFALLTVLNVLVLGLILTFFVRRQLGQEFESFLMATAREKIVAVSKQLSLDLSVADAAQRDAILGRYTTTYGLHFRLYDSQGLRVAGTETALPAEVTARLVRPSAPPRAFTGLGPPPFLIEAGDPQRYWIGVRTLLPAPDLQHATRATLLLESQTLLSNPFLFEWEPWAGILLTAVLVTALCWFPLVRGLTRDIHRMTVATAAVAEGQFDVRLETRRGDELGRLGGSINQMTGRLRDYVEGQKRFLGDVAHELRSPLGRMQVELGILERKTAAEDQGYVRDLQEDVEMLSGLTTELLTFARSELKREPVALSHVALRTVVERAVQAEAPDGVNIAVEIEPALTAKGNENLLFRAISNLIRNAVRHGCGDITVAAHRQDEHVILTVADRGAGVPEEALEKIFTPFFRIDSARGRKKGGTGLGLAIVRNYVEMCGGSVLARNRPEGGLELVVTLPR
jgi:two-component system sensor histidine kinase CpxA